MRRRQRRLPHWEILEQPLFVTFRLYGSLPENRVFPLHQMTSGKAFVALDRLLDQAVTGPLLLRQPEIAEFVVAALRDGDRRFHRYDLHSFVVMPNHVHALVTPHVFSDQWLGPLKGFTAHRANLFLGRSGSPFWQDESYDRLVRSQREFERMRLYIEENPVKAGLVASVEKFRWSSAYRPDP